MTDAVTLSQNGSKPADDVARKRANLAPIGATGVVTYGGILFTSDYDRSWQGVEKDRTIMQMLNDPVLGACLLGIEMLIRRVDWRVEPADDSAKAQAAAELVESCLKEMRGYWPGDTMAKILTYLGWGFSVLEIVYRQRDDGALGWDAWRLIPQVTRRGWEFDDTGEPSALIQIDPQTYHDIVIPLERCLVFRYASRDNSPEGTSPLRVAFDAWYRKSKIQIIEGIGLERDLAGLPVGRVPGADIEAGNAPYLAMQAIVTGIRNDAQAGLVLASERDETGHYFQDFMLLSTGGGRAIDTDPIVRRYANEMVTVFLANIMRTGQDGVGSFALSQTQGGLFQQAIAAHLDTIGDAITTQALPRLLAVNGLDPALTPSLVHGDIETTDLTELGTYLTNLATAGLLGDTPELTAFVHEVAGLPTPTAEDIAQQRADEEAKAAKAEAAAKAAAAAPPAPSSTAAEPPVDALANATPGGPVQSLTEARQLVEADGTLTLSDLTEILAFWRANVPAEYAELLNASILGGKGGK